jgi:transcriptional regulator with PAS, ATPase and Fis domain
VRESDLQLDVQLTQRISPPPRVAEQPLRCAESLGSVDAHEEAKMLSPAPSAAQTLGELEEQAIRTAYARHAGRRRAMAAELGIAKSSLLRKLSALGLR